MPEQTAAALPEIFETFGEARQAGFPALYAGAIGAACLALETL